LKPWYDFIKFIYALNTGQSPNYSQCGLKLGSTQLLGWWKGAAPRLSKMCDRKLVSLHIHNGKGKKSVLLTNKQNHWPATQYKAKFTKRSRCSNAKFNKTESGPAGVVAAATFRGHEKN
jgi:hypothetical protein